MLSLSSGKMNVANIHSSAHAAPIPLDQLANRSNLSEDQKIAEASRQFESVLLRQILGEARKPVFNSKFTQQSAVTGIYNDMVTTQLADSISASGEFGLARSLTPQLQTSSHGDAKASNSTSTPATAPTLTPTVRPTLTDSVDPSHS